jgi:hypothetical protein
LPDKNSRDVSRCIYNSLRYLKNNYVFFSPPLAMFRGTLFGQEEREKEKEGGGV